MQTIEDICRKIQNCKWIPGDLYDLVPKVIQLQKENNEKDERTKELEAENGRLNNQIDLVRKVQRICKSRGEFVTEENLEQAITAPRSKIGE